MAESSVTVTTPFNYDEDRRVDEMNESELSVYLENTGRISHTDVDAIQGRHHLNGKAFVDLSKEKATRLTDSIELRRKLLKLANKARIAETNYITERAEQHQTADKRLNSQMNRSELLVDATAFPQNLALLVVTITAGDAKQFYVATLCLLLIAMTLQPVLALMVVLLPNTLKPGKLKLCVIVLLVVLNLTADALVIAQGGTLAESSQTSNGSMT